MHQFDLKNKTAIITGGAQGFGLDIAKRFLKSGAKAIIWDIDEDELKKAINDVITQIFHTMLLMYLILKMLKKLLTK